MPYLDREDEILYKLILKESMDVYKFVTLKEFNLVVFTAPKTNLFKI